MNTVTMSAIIVTLFLGGPQPIAFGDWTANIPLIPNGLEGTVWFVLKLFVFLYVYVWLRATLPRLRYDQLMDLGWKVLIPIALGWFLLLAAIRVGNDNDWNIVAVVGDHASPGSPPALGCWCSPFASAARTESARGR